MEKLVLTIPTLYGDHHTTAIKDILAGIDGVQDSYVSAAFQQVSVTFDPKKVESETIKQSLADQGYSEGDVQGGFATEAKERATRHTASYPGTGDTLAFATNAASFEGRPLWPCPGLSITTPAEEA
jgi:copper chaperone CopZ